VSGSSLIKIEEHGNAENLCIARYQLPIVYDKLESLRVKWEVDSPFTALHKPDAHPSQYWERAALPQPLAPRHVHALETKPAKSRNSIPSSPSCVDQQPSIAAQATLVVNVPLLDDYNQLREEVAADMFGPGSPVSWDRGRVCMRHQHRERVFVAATVGLRDFVAGSWAGIDFGWWL
jgi:hypothetical protein